MKYLAIFLTVLLFGCSQPKEQELMVDTNATELVSQIESYKGEKPVLVNFWATWCIPCIEEFPYIMKLKENYSDEFELIFVSGDFEEAKEEAKEFLKEQNVNFTTYYKTGKDNEFIQTVSDKWSGALPYTVIYSKDGSISAEWEGKAEYEKFEQELLKVIEEG
ncbi:MAG: TlpA disulfide reductase family protein [Balneola sp.]|jgi:thiol-disulfide isomerase/thioredoxin